MKKQAVFSPCGHYRYALWSIWDESRPYVLFIGLNPSETEDNPTIRRCSQYAQDWGYGGLCMANLFAWRTGQPEYLKCAEDPVGPENDQFLQKLSKGAGIVVAAWGNEGRFNQRSSRVLAMLDSVKCLKVNKSGEPAHPLYQPAKAMPVEFR